MVSRTGLPLSLIVLDIDYFKPFNDHHGHGAGDICLCHVATTLAASVTRSGDLVARYGGEEFVALLPNTGEAGALQIAERLRGQIEALRMPHGYSPASAWVTVSAGLASTVPQADESPDRLFEKADQQLYGAKQAGRNRVCR